MEEQGFEATNDLERELIAAQRGDTAPEAFMQYLLTAQVFMPVEERHQIQGLQASTQANPLTLESEEGETVLILFTSPERAKEFVRDFPGYEGGLLTEFKWILEKAGLGYGVSINPGWPVGLDLAPQDVQQLRQAGGGQ